MLKFNLNLKLFKIMSSQQKSCWSYKKGACITAIGNTLASGNLCFRVLKLQLKVINKNFVIWPFPNHHPGKI